MRETSSRSLSSASKRSTWEYSSSAARRVLHSVRDAGADGLVVNCPYCFSQYVTGQRKANSQYMEDIGVPVLYFTELIGLAMGIDPVDLGMHLHYRASVGRERELVDRILGRPSDDSALRDDVTRRQ